MNKAESKADPSSLDTTSPGTSATAFMWRNFRRNRIALTAAVVLLLTYLIVAFAEFFAPYPVDKFHDFATFTPPQKLHFIDDNQKFHLRPFVYAWESVLDQRLFVYRHQEKRDQRFPIYFFVRAEPYKLLGLFPTDIHFFGNPNLPIFLLGTDEFGRDLLSRIIFGARISLTVGLLGVALTTLIGVLLGGISGYYGGQVDNLIQRFIEITVAIPRLPVYLALSAAFPRSWNSIQIFFAMILILSVIEWGRLARQLRGIVLSIREADFVTAARAVGQRDLPIIVKHILPGTISHIVAVSTLAIPGIILAESTLSFLGVGIQTPMVSLGVLLNKAQNITYLQNYPWTMLPGVAIVIIILAFNFLGDGLRDAADPHSY